MVNEFIIDDEELGELLEVRLRLCRYSCQAQSDANDGNLLPIEMPGCPPRFSMHALGTLQPVACLLFAPTVDAI